MQGSNIHKVLFKSQILLKKKRNTPHIVNLLINILLNGFSLKGSKIEQTIDRKIFDLTRCAV
jgi:hypothetical protein